MGNEYEIIYTNFKHTHTQLKLLNHIHDAKLRVQKNTMLELMVVSF